MGRELTGKEIKAVNRLIKSECCNYCDGNAFYWMMERNMYVRRL